MYHNDESKVEEKEVVIESYGELGIETKYGWIEYIMPKGYDVQAIYYDFEDVIRLVKGTEIIDKVDCEKVEDDYNLSTYAVKRIYNLKCENPQEYYDIHNTSEFKDYVETLNRSSAEMNSSYSSWFKERYPDMSDTQIQLEVNMLMFYDN